MFVQQFFVKGLAHSSYLLGGANHCAIVDPQRDIQIYIDAAKDLGMKITHIIETHLHADFISGHLDLARATGAKIYAPKAGKCSFKHKALSEGDRFNIDDLAISVLETPGHTPEHISYVVVDKLRGKEPVAVFCGDTLFVGDVGRPDLFPGKAKQLASKLYDNLHNKLMKLPDFCAVYPAHGAGSLCGRAMGANRTSTIGYERRYNAALQIKDKDEFIKSLTTNMPAAPDHFARCSAINSKGPALVSALPELRAYEPAEFDKLARRKNTSVLDIRSYESFGGAHIARAFHIDAGGNFSTFAGWVIPPEKEILLVVDKPEDAWRAAKMLRRVGIDKVVGFLDGSMFSWSKAGMPLDHVQQWSAKELYTAMHGKNPVTVVDVRAPGEFAKSHIKGAINIPAPELRKRYRELNAKKPVAFICSTGHRSSLAASLVEQHGFNSVYNVAGGMTGYTDAGYAKECPMCMLPHGPRYLGVKA